MQAIGSSRLGYDCCCSAGLQTLGVALFCKNKKKGGRRGLCPWPLRCLSQLLSERKERMLRGGEYVSYGDVSQNLPTFHRWGGLVFIVDVQLVGR